MRKERSKNKDGELKASRKDLYRRKTSEYNSKWFGDRITKDTRRKFTMKFKNNEIKKIVAEYIRNQLEEDYAADQISIKEFVDPFTGAKNK